MSTQAVISVPEAIDWSSLILFLLATPQLSPSPEDPPDPIPFGPEPPSTVGEVSEDPAPPPSNPILWLLEAIGTTSVPHEEEMARLSHLVGLGLKASALLGEKVGLLPSTLRLWARSRLLSAEVSSPIGDRVRTALEEAVSPHLRALREEGPWLHHLFSGEEAFLHLVRGNLKLVVHVAKGYARPGLDLNDLVGYGTLGLMVAVERFNPRLGYRFATYAYHWIRKWVAKGALAKAPPSLSLDAPVPETDGEILYGDLLAWQGEAALPSPEEEALRRDEARRLRRALRGLPWPHALALLLREGRVTGRPVRNEELAYILGLPKGAIPRLLKQAKALLRARLS